MLDPPLATRRPTPGRELDRPAGRPRRWLLVATTAGVLVLLGFGWVWLWYYAASIADRTLAAWVEREAAAGRIYSCASQTISGFPFGIEARCTEAAAQVAASPGPISMTAKSLNFAAQVYRPTALNGEIVAPVTLTQGQAARFTANWSRARLSLRGLPPDPKSVSVALDKPRLMRGAADGETAATFFSADELRLESRIIDGSGLDHPVIEAVLHFSVATAPSVHPLLAAPLDGEIDVVIRGLKDFSPKPWSDRFREIQAAGGAVEVKSLRLARADAMVVGIGTLNVNAHGKLEGLVRVAIAGIDRLAPQLGLDRIMGRGIDRLTGSEGGTSQALGALDRLVPGLGNAVRETASATLIENLKKMGQPTEIDKNPAILLPLRFADGSIYLGMVPLGEVPALF